MPSRRRSPPGLSAARGQAGRRWICRTINRSWPSSAGERPRPNFLDHLRLGVSVVLNIFPATRLQLQLGPFAELTVGRVLTKPVPEGAVTFDFPGSVGPDVEVDVGIRTLEHPVRFGAVEW